MNHSQAPEGAPTGAALSQALNPARVVMIQDGSRRRFAVPLALQQAGILERVFADWLVTPSSFEERLARLVRRFLPALGAKMAERGCAALPADRVVRNPWLALRLRLSARWHASAQDYYQTVARKTSRWILRQGFGQANALYGFVHNVAPEVYAAARRRGLKTAGDQIIAPVAVELAEAREQARRWPGWEAAGAFHSRARMRDWEERTWAELDRVTCMSEYVRQGLIAQGFPAERITLIEYPFDAGAFHAPDRGRRSGPVTVGFVGAVGLRKGAPYFFEVARRFDPRQARFVMVGRVDLDPAKGAAHRGHVELAGEVPHSRVAEFLERFDVFFFPTTCEGSAGAVMEAMASGLPVVTTPNSGTTARDGVEGFVVPHPDLDLLTDRLRQLVEDPELRLRMGQAARRRAEAFSLDWYARVLGDFFRHLLTEASPAAPVRSTTAGPAA